MAKIPPGWTRQPAQFDDGEWSVSNPWGSRPGATLEFETDQYAEFYLGFNSMAALWFPEVYADEDAPEARVAAEMRRGALSLHAAVSPRGRGWMILEVPVEETEYFSNRSDALTAAAEVAHDALTTRVNRMPDWRNEDLRKYLSWFLAQQPNRMDYVNLFWANDRNGAYDGLLREPLSESEETFAQVFADYGPFTFPSTRRQAIFGVFGSPKTNPEVASDPCALRRRLVRR